MTKEELSMKLEHCGVNSIYQYSDQDNHCYEIKLKSGRVITIKIDKMINMCLSGEGHLYQYIYNEFIKSNHIQ